jgi:hypothetical protein
MGEALATKAVSIYAVSVQWEEAREGGTDLLDDGQRPTSADIEISEP